MRGLLKTWWRGTYVKPPYDPNIVFLGHYELHWTSKVAHIIAEFWLKYWQWCMGFGLGVVALILKH